MTSKRVKWMSYKEDQIQEAVNEVRRGIPLQTASRHHGIPRTTLRRYTLSKSFKLKKMGPPPTLSEEEENILVQWLELTVEAGVPVNKTNLLDSAEKLIKDLNKPNNFKNNRPGRKWLENFLKRNPTANSLLAEKPKKIEKKVVSNWFSKVFKYLKNYQFDYLLSQPNRIFNTLEFAFFLNPKGNKSLAIKDNKNINSEDCLSVLITTNAEGLISPVFVVHKYEKIPANSKSGSVWMTELLFDEFITKIFHPWLSQNKILRPIILFTPGHPLNLSLHSNKFCEENGIILISLSPKALNSLQPMDNDFVSTLKSNWEFKFQEWKASNPNISILNKKDFYPLIKEALEEIKPSVIQSGFRRCGLYPWNHAEVSSRPNFSLNALTTSLNVVEEYLGPEKVAEFERVGSSECVQTVDVSLYELWVKIKGGVDTKVKIDNDSCQSKESVEM